MLLVGIILNGKFKKILKTFIDGEKEVLSFSKGSTRTFWVLLITLLPFLLYLFVFSLFAVIEFVIYGYTAITSLPRIPIAALIGLAIVGIWTVIGILIWIYYLFFSSRKEPLWIVLKWNEEKKLWNLVNEVSKEIQAKPIDKIIITPNPNMGVYLEWRFIRTMFWGGKRILQIWLPSLHNLTIDELKAILAHEYWHFSNKDTQWLSFTYVMGNSLISAKNSMPWPSQHKDWEWSLVTLIMALNPAYWILSLYVRLYFFITNWFSRIGEVKSDVSAMQLYGGKAFRDWLLKISMNDLIFSEVIEKTILPDILEKWKIISNFSLFMDFSYKKTDKETISSFENLIMDTKNISDTYDSHPSTNIRVEYSKRFDKKLSQDKTLAKELFSKRDKINEKVAELYNQRLISNLQALAKEESTKTE